MEEIESEFPKKIGLFSLVILGIASLTGAGIYSLIGPTANIAGPAIIISLIIGSVLAFLVAGLYSELISLYPESGGGFIFVEKAYGEKALYLGWITWLANMAYAALVCHTAGYFITTLFQIDPFFSVPIGILFALLMAAANLFGSKFLSRVQIPLTFALIASLIIGALYLFNRPDNSIVWNNSYFLPYGMFPVLTAAALLFNIFIGFEDVCSIAEETRNPRKNVPRAYLIMLIVATILYLLVVFSLFISTRLSEIRQSEVAFLDAVNENIIVYLIVYFGAVFALLTTAGIAIMASSRNVYALARSDFMDRRYSKLNEKNGAPVKAISLSTIIIILILTSGQISFYASISVITYMIGVISLGLTVIKLRKTIDYPKETFKIPGHPYSTIVAVGTAALLISSLEFISLIVSFFWLLIGLILYLFFSSKRRAYGTIFLVAAFFFAISSLVFGIIILSIGFIYYLISISDRSSIKLTLTGIKCFFAIVSIILILTIKFNAILDFKNSNIRIFFNYFVINILIIACIIILISIIFEIIPLKEWIYYFYKNKKKNEVAIKIGNAQIIELNKPHLRVIYYFNDLLGILQLLSLIIIFLPIGMLFNGLFSIMEIEFINVIMTKNTSEFLFVTILFILGTVVGLSAGLFVYFNKESKKIGI